MSSRRFRIAFSFPGEKRDFVEQVANVLASRFGNSAILYDKFHESEFARYDLGLYLPKLYAEQSDLIVPLFCPEYDSKRWTGWEWNQIFSLLTQADCHRVMLSRFNYATVSGLSATAAFIELDKKTPTEFARLILERLAINEQLPKDFYVRNSALEGVSATSMSNAQEIADDFAGGVSALDAIGINPNRMSFRKLIHETTISKVAIYALEESEYIVKRTKSGLCQPETLRRLAEKKYIGNRDGIEISVGVPLALWTANGFIYELRRYYKGITLEELVLKNRFRIQGEFLARFHNGFVRTLSDLHEFNIVHRDVQPRNILIASSGEIVLLDSTLACQIGSDQVAVDSVYYTAPEQLEGNALPGSDIYSLGAVEFFVANRFPPGICSPKQYVAALKAVDFGGWRSRGDLQLPDGLAEPLKYCDGGQFVARMLLKDAEQRPSSLWDLLLETGSRPMFTRLRNVVSILDAGDLGLLVCGESDYRFVERKDVKATLEDLLRERNADDQGLANRGASTEVLRQAIKRHLAGQPEWRL